MGLIETLKQDKNTRKIFGKREIEIIEKQLKGIKLTPSEQTRLYRDIRKKFDAITNLSKYTEEFELKKGAIIKQLIKRAETIILGSKYFSRINKIVLFGSAAENQLNYRSDIDIAVIFKNITKEEAEDFRITALSRAPKEIDIQVYNFLPEKIKVEIDKKGKSIWKKE
jgi:predicted nucleotidyltransferase